MICFFGKSIAFLPSPMVARNAWGSNSRLFLEATRGRAELRVLWDIRPVGVWRAIFVEPLGSRGEAMGAPPLTPRSYRLYPLLRWRASQYSGHRGHFPLIATLHETPNGFSWPQQMEPILHDSAPEPTYMVWAAIW